MPPLRFYKNRRFKDSWHQGEVGDSLLMFLSLLTFLFLVVKQNRAKIDEKPHPKHDEISQRDGHKVPIQRGSGVQGMG